MPTLRSTPMVSTGAGAAQTSSTTFGNRPKDAPSLASGLKQWTDSSDVTHGIRADRNVAYAYPVGFAQASTVATATAVTLTAHQVLGGVVLQDPSGGAVTTTLPTAAALVSYAKGLTPGSCVRFLLRNTADAAEAITVAAGTGITVAAGSTLTVAQNKSAEYLIVFTNVTPGSEAAIAYTVASDHTH